MDSKTSDIIEDDHPQDLNQANEPIFLKLSEEINALDDVHQAIRFLRDVETNIIHWKWVVIALHQALYNCAVCACKGTDYTSVTKDGKGVWLIGFDEALRRCQDPTRMRMTISSKHLQLTPEQKHSIDLLHKQFRNNFAHYVPRLWWIEVTGFPDMVIDCLQVIQFLATESGNYAMLELAQRAKLSELVKEGIDIAHSLKTKDRGDFVCQT